MVGIGELKDVIAFGAGIGNALGKSLEDGKISLGEYVNFIPALLDFPAAVQGFDKVKAEILDIDPEEKIELEQFVKDRFDIAQDDAEEFIEDAIGVALDVFEFVNKHFIKKDTDQ